MGVHRACFFIARAGRAATPERNRSGNQPPILCILPLVAHQLASARDFFPLGIVAELFPCLPGGLAVGESHEVDQLRSLAVLVVERSPETDQLGAVLLEQLAGMVAKPLVQIGQLAIVGVIGSQLEHAVGCRGCGLTLCLALGERNAGQAGQDQSGGKNANHHEWLPGKDPDGMTNCGMLSCENTPRG